MPAITNFNVHDATRIVVTALQSNEGTRWRRVQIYGKPGEAPVEITVFPEKEHLPVVDMAKAETDHE